MESKTKGAKDSKGFEIPWLRMAWGAAFMAAGGAYVAVFIAGGAGPGVAACGSWSPPPPWAPTWR